MISRKKLFEFNYVYSSEEYNYFKIVKPFKIHRLIFELFRLFRNLIGAFFLDIIESRFILKKNQILFYYATNNQYDCMLPVQKVTKGSSFFTLRKRVKRKGNVLPLFPCYLLSIPFIPLLFFYLIIERGYKKKAIAYFFTEFLVTFGYKLVFYVYLLILRPRGVVIGNDTRAEYRVLVSVCSKLGIPTFYIPHGFSYLFEIKPDAICDHYLLQGKVAAENYIFKHGKRAHLIGYPKLDCVALSIKRSSGINSVGLCTNSLDDYKLVKELIEVIRTEIPDLKLVYRPHPGSNDDSSLAFARKYGMDYSNSDIERSTDFFQKVDMVVAGQSSIFLEAAYVNVYPLSVRFSDNQDDFLGLLRNNIVEYKEEPENVVALINVYRNESFNVRSRLVDFIEGTGGGGDIVGESSKTAANIIIENAKELL